MVYTLYLQDEDIDRPLLSGNWGDHSRQSNSFLGSSVGEPSKIQTNRSNTSPRSHAITDTGRIYPAECCATQGIIIIPNHLVALLEYQLCSCLCWIAPIMDLQQKENPVADNLYLFCRRNSCNQC